MKDKPKRKWYVIVEGEACYLEGIYTDKAEAERVIRLFEKEYEMLDEHYILACQCQE